jgi:hypothetical protein
LCRRALNLLSSFPFLSFIYLFFFRQPGWLAGGNYIDAMVSSRLLHVYSLLIKKRKSLCLSTLYASDSYIVDVIVRQETFPCLKCSVPHPLPPLQSPVYPALSTLYKGPRPQERLAKGWRVQDDSWECMVSFFLKRLHPYPNSQPDQSLNCRSP